MTGAHQVSVDDALVHGHPNQTVDTDVDTLGCTCTYTGMRGHEALDTYLSNEGDTDSRTLHMKGKRRKLSNVVDMFTFSSCDDSPKLCFQQALLPILIQDHFVHINVQRLCVLKHLICFLLLMKMLQISIRVILFQSTQLKKTG
jgi:hypothetical protein